MQQSGYGKLRFGNKWPVTFDLECNPLYISSTVWNRDKDDIVILIVKNNDKYQPTITTFVFEYYDNVVLPEELTDYIVLYDSRKDK